MSNVIVLDDNVYTKLEKNAAIDGVTPEVWVSKIIDQEFDFANRPRLSTEQRANLNTYQKDLDARLGKIMKKRYQKKMGLDVK